MNMLTAVVLIGAIAAILALIAHPGKRNALALAALAAVLIRRTGARLCEFLMERHKNGTRSRVV